MAKTNDGNLLQHFVECQVVSLLNADTSDTPAASGVHLVCTHAMAPFEAGETSLDDPHARRLARALAHADRDASWPVLQAYAKTKAAPDQYPNTAELVASLVGESALSGVLCEKDEIHASVLMNRWATSDVDVRKGNWRNALAAGALDAPSEPRPWLLTLDPYTWLLPREVNKASQGPRLAQPDLERLRPVLGRYAQASVPGAWVVSVYGVDEAHAADFRRAVIAVADRLGLERTFLGLPGPDDTRHLSAVGSPTPGLAAQLAEAWATFRAELEAA